MADPPEKHFKTPVLKMPEELQEDVEKMKKMIYEQNGNIDKEIENLWISQWEILELKSKISKKFIKVIQRQIWADRINNQVSLNIRQWKLLSEEQKEKR